MLARLFQSFSALHVTARAMPFVFVSFSAVGALAQGGQPSPAALRAACSDDAARLCSGVPSGGGRIVACLKQHQDQLSNSCRAVAGLPPKPDATPAAPPAPSAPAVASSSPTPSTASTTILGKPTRIAGETYVRRVITDPAHNNVAAATLHVPEKWTLDSKIEWHYNWVEYPLGFSVNVTNPANVEAYFLYPLQRMDSVQVTPQYRQYMRGKTTKPGDREATGAISMPLQQPIPALENFIKQTRSGAQNLKWVGKQDLPDLAKVLGLDPLPGDHGVAIKVSYELDGHPVDEAFFGVYYVSTGSPSAQSVGNMHMAANAIQQTNWGFRALQSFRAPAGTLEKRMPVFCLIAKSLAYNPEWLKLGKDIQQQMIAAFNQRIQQGYDQIRAGQATMQQMMAQEKAFDKNVASFDAGLRAPAIDDSWLRTTGGSGGGSGGRGSFDKGDDVIRGVDTVQDATTGGTKQLTNAGQYHFTDGFGNYRTSDDPNYTPEKNGEVGSWQAMPPAL